MKKLIAKVQSELLVTKGIAQVLVYGAIVMAGQGALIVALMRALAK